MLVAAGIITLMYKVFLTTRGVEICSSHEAQAIGLGTGSDSDQHLRASAPNLVGVGTVRLMRRIFVELQRKCYSPR